VIDLAQFARALHVGTLLSDPSLQTMYTTFVLPDGRNTGYGLGWHIGQDESGTWVSHGGSATGGAAYLLHRPTRGLVIALACNLEVKSSELGDIARELDELLQEFRDA
jgi:hypothetical protein